MMESFVGWFWLTSNRQESVSEYAHYTVCTSVSIRSCGILEEHGCLPWALDPGSNARCNSEAISE